MADKNYAPSFNLIGSENCCGCGGCHNICPTGAISMSPDTEGFSVPVLDTKKCINCKKCISVCPIENAPEAINPLRSMGITNKNTDVLLNSSSGGIFSSFANAFLKKYTDTFIVGVVYDDDYKSVKHTISNDIRDIYKMQVSKYVQSDKKNIYREVKDKLTDGKHILFTGLPCEIAALKRFLGQDYSNLLTVDIMCKGPASPLVLKQYVDYMEQKRRAHVTGINMRYKWKELDNWIPQYIRIDFDRGKPYIKEFYNTLLGQCFRIMQRASCARCKYTSYTHLSDITIGDFHGAGKGAVYFNKLGTSALVINTEKGRLFFDDMDKSSLIYEDAPLDEIYRHNLRHNTNPRRDSLSKMLVSSGIKKAVMSNISFKDKLKLIVPGDIFRRISRLFKK